MSKSTKKAPAKKKTATKKRSASGFAPRKGQFQDVKQLHVNLDKSDRAKLEKLSIKTKLTASEWVRAAIRAAKVAA